MILLGKPGHTDSALDRQSYPLHYAPRIRGQTKVRNNNFMALVIGNKEEHSKGSGILIGRMGHADSPPGIHIPQP